MIVMAFWGLSQPTLQSLMTKEVGPTEQGRLQGANQTSMALAGVLGPLVWGGLHGALLGTVHYQTWGGTPFVAAGILLATAAAFSPLRPPVRSGCTTAYSSSLAGGRRDENSATVDR